MLLFYGLKFQVSYFWGNPRNPKCVSMFKNFLECPLPTLGSNLVRLTLVPVDFYPGFYRKSFVLTWTWVTRIRFQIIAFSNRSTLDCIFQYVFMIVFILSVWTGSENVAIFLLFQMKTHLKTHLYKQRLNPGFKCFSLKCVSRKVLESFYRSDDSSVK